jgi:hypothetical protein
VPKSRDLLLIACSVLCLLGLGVVMLTVGGDPVVAAEGDPPDPEPRGTPVEAPVAPDQFEAAEVPFHKSERSEPVEALVSQPTRTDGLIRGDIALVASAVSKIQAISVRINEAVDDSTAKRAPFSRVVTLPFDPTDGTPKFSIDGIPFSVFGYTVEAFAPGLNGTAQVVHIDASRPIADVILGIHPGVPFSLLLRDQDLVPLANVEVTMQPDGAPLGRPTYAKTTDSYGAAVFQDVLRGAYLAHFGPLTQPLRAPEPIEVLGASGMQAQSKTVQIAKGETLTVNVFNATGHGLAEVEVKLSSGSDTRYREFKKNSDWAGKAAFEHVPAGTYWVNVLDPRFEPRTLPAVVRANEKPKDVNIHLRMR